MAYLAIRLPLKFVQAATVGRHGPSFLAGHYQQEALVIDLG